MKLAFLMILLTAFVLGGCGNTKEDQSAESVDEVAQADTAAIEGAGEPEALPVADEVPAESVATTEANPVVSETPPSEPPAEATVTSEPPQSTGENAVSSNEMSGSGEVAQYGVQRGDTLMKIAFNLYGDILKWKSLHELNKDAISNANKLEVGMQLKYERPFSDPAVERNGEPYMIKQGDTLGSIADDVYAKRSKWRKIYENNRALIKDPNLIYAGFYLYYQITEQEKQEAEEIRARRGGEKLSTTDSLPDSASVKSMLNGGSGGGAPIQPGQPNSAAAPAEVRAPAGSVQN
ncbi:MAG: LysM peptidoglycan-binding domain-containing protein [Bdellovibrionota bacterium]